MEQEKIYVTESIDAEKEYSYAQSANSLFHFMKEYRFLEEILLKRVIVPRFYVEDISYLELRMMGQQFDEAAVLQKCFCDIPLHQISNIARVDKLDKQKKERKTQYYCHTDFYGNYGIALSKEWAESHNVQPVHYINERTEFCRNFSHSIATAFETEELNEEIANSFLQRLAYMKPLKGWMPVSDGYVYKNFHDEREWRFVPEDRQGELDTVIANPNICSDRGHLEWMNTSLKQQVYERLWLHYGYDDITYLIVPDNLARQQLIDSIMGISDAMFSAADGEDGIQRQKYTLMSKIMVLSQIRKDF